MKRAKSTRRQANPCDCDGKPEPSLVVYEHAANPVVLEPTKEGWKGQSRGVALSSLPQAELAVGTKHELEHVGSKRVAKRIAADHLVEDPHYYRHLAQMERQHRKGNPGDADEARAHAEQLAQALRQQPGAPAPRVWAKPGVGARVYLPNGDFLAVGRDGSLAVLLRGKQTLDERRLPQGQRRAYRAGVAAYLRALRESAAVSGAAHLADFDAELARELTEVRAKYPRLSDEDARELALFRMEPRQENPTKRKGAPDAQEQCLAKVADGLLPFAKRVFGSNDVLIWHDGERVRIAFRADALRIEAVYKRAMLYNRNSLLDIDMQRAVGLDAKSKRDGMWTGIDGGLGQILDTPETHYAQVLEGVEQCASEVLRPCLGVEEPEPRVTAVFLPNEGGPLAPYYSARKRAWFAAEPPPATSMFTVEVEDDRGHQAPQQVIGVDVCSRYPRITDCGTDIEAVSGPESSDFFVVHATTPTPEAAELVAKCGGFLFPSLAVGQLPSSTFGPLVLVAGVGLVLDTLKPYRTSRKLPVHVYDTDTWTITSLAIPYAAQILYNQLTGRHEESVYGTYGGMGHNNPHQWVLGAPTSLSSISGHLEAKVITSTRQLAKELAARARAWRGPDAKKILDRYGDTKHRYPYMEAKVNGMLAPSCFQLAVTPKSWKSASQAYMKKIGISVPLLEVPDPPGTGQRLVGGGTKNITAQWLSPTPGDQNVLTFQRLVGQVIRDYATAHGLRRGYEL